MATITPTFGALNVSQRPIEYVSTQYGPMGHYAIAVTSGATVSLTANDPILSYRWTSTVANAVLLRVAFTSAVTASITTPVVVGLEAVFARAFTVADSAGTASTLSNMQKLRSSMGNSLLGDLRVSTTAKLTAGTRTLDTGAFGGGNAVLFPTVTNIGSASAPVELYKYDGSGRHPVVFAAQEGFIVRCPVALNTSGSIAHTFTVEWAEVPLSGSF